jgi:glycosyltransferase involved in cell wall biosynthesis
MRPAVPGTRAGSASVPIAATGPAPLRVFLHDFSGHPPQVELSRELARRGHHVLHSFSAEFPTPQADLVRRPDDPPTFAVAPIALGRPFRKHAYLARQRQEIAFGRRLGRQLEAFRPDVAVLANAPPTVLAFAQAACRRRRVPFVFWLMDLYSVAIRQVLSRRQRLLGAVVGSAYAWLERRQLRLSDRVIAISAGFRPALAAWGIAADRTRVMPLWAPLADMPVRPKANPWSLRHGLATTRNIVYAGTLGLKHDPGVLLALARHLQAGEARAAADVRLVVVSEGIGAEALARARAAEGLDRLVLLPFQPFTALPEVLAAADVLLALLDAEAGVYCVPSKVLTNLCAGRPQVVSMPPENRSAEVIVESGGGVLVPPGDARALIAAVDRLLADPAGRDRLGRAARAYAETAFAIGPIADAFEAELLALCRG